MTSHRLFGARPCIAVAVALACAIGATSCDGGDPTSTISGISCLTDQCVVTGFSRDEGFVASSDLSGGNWVVHSVPEAMTLSSISCVSTRTCVAIGSTQVGQAVFISEGGLARWKVEVVEPAAVTLSTVFCNSQECVLGGSVSGPMRSLCRNSDHLAEPPQSAACSEYGYLATSTNLESWKSETVPASVTGVFDLDCLAQSCVAVGEGIDSLLSRTFGLTVDREPAIVVEPGADAVWHLAPLPSQVEDEAGALTAVACSGNEGICLTTGSMLPNEVAVLNHSFVPARFRTNEVLRSDDDGATWSVPTDPARLDDPGTVYCDPTGPCWHDGRFVDLDEENTSTSAIHGDVLWRASGTSIWLPVGTLPALAESDVGGCLPGGRCIVVGYAGEPANGSVQSALVTHNLGLSWTKVTTPMP